MKAACLFVPLILLAACTQKSGGGKEIWAKSILGQKAPELVVEKWLTEKPDTNGKFVIVEFWATWCAPCLETINHLNEFQKNYPDKLVVIGISEESEADVRKLTLPKIEYSSAIDTQARMKNTLEVKGIPHAIVMDPEGIVRWEGYPLMDGDELTGKVLEKIFSKYGK